LEAAFILLEFKSLSRRIFIGIHSLPPSLVRRIGPSEEFLTEGIGETAVFLAHIERGFGVPAGNFFSGLFFFYRIELVHLVLISITIISTFIHLCEAYLSIARHIHQWCHFFKLQEMGKSGVVGSVGFMLRQYMKPEYVNLVLLDNTIG
jgi:hypothetical protein